MTGIYKIENLINNKVFIGKSTDVEAAFQQHRELRRAKSLPVEKEMALYGLKNFKFEIVEECAEGDLDVRAIENIRIFDSAKNGYNSADMRPGRSGSAKNGPKKPLGAGLLAHTMKMRTDPSYRQMMVEKYKNNRPNAIAVDMIDRENGEIIMTFPKIMDAAAWVRENTNYKRADYATINKVCKGQGKTAYGYKFRYTRDR